MVCCRIKRWRILVKDVFHKSFHLFGIQWVPFVPASRLQFVFKYKRNELIFDSWWLWTLIYGCSQNLPLIWEMIPTSEASKKFSTKVPFRMIIFWFVPEMTNVNLRSDPIHIQTFQISKAVDMRHFCCWHHLGNEKASKPEQTHLVLGDFLKYTKFIWQLFSFCSVITLLWRRILWSWGESEGT